MTVTAVIVAAGRGTRMGSKTPKQYHMLNGASVLTRTIERFLNHSSVSDVIVVIHRDDDALFDDVVGLRDQVNVVYGGNTRGQSVRNGLGAVTTDHVLIHDGARASVSDGIINRVIDALEDHVAAAPAVPVTDALWRGVDNTVTGTADRDGLYRAQTPQGFHTDTLRAAYDVDAGNAADDVAVARAAGIDVRITMGDDDNIKLTTPPDFVRAARVLDEKAAMMDIRLGNGYDVHRFGDGDHVVLCGVTVPFNRGLQGHSDADVGMHAVTDAIYGALAMGDIGQHFPPSDMQWKGAASHIFLEHAVALAAEHGFAISNVDCTLVCEQPKIGPHAVAMRTEMARIMGMDVTRVSVKATTSERLGFTGRKEGIAAIATATLIKDGA